MTFTDEEAMDVLCRVAQRQTAEREVLMVDCANCEGIGWFTEIEVLIHGRSMIAGGDCPVCGGRGKVMPS